MVRLTLNIESGARLVLSKAIDTRATYRIAQYFTSREDNDLGREV